MKNYEWLKLNDNLLKSLLLDGLFGVYKNKPINCMDIQCHNCDLYVKNHSCDEKLKEWLEAEHEPQYKKGDIVIIDEKGSLWIFVRETNSGNALLTRNVLDVDVEIGIDMNIKTNDIKKKVGNIYD